MNAFLQLVDGLGTSWAEVMGRALWQSAVLAAAIYGLTCCLRRQPATMRYWLWMLVPLRLLVMPLITLPLPVLPAANDPPIPVTLAPVGSVSPVAEDRWNTPEPIASLAASRTTIPSLDVPDRADARSPATPTSVSWSAPSLVASLLGLWAAGALFFAVRLTRGWMATRRFIRASVAITDPSILAMARQVAQTIGVTPLPRLARTRLDISPLVCGLRQPVIVLPEAAVHASPEELRAILAHEMAHLRRRDPLAGWLLAICELAYFFHPVFHLVRRQILLEREIACDELVLGTLAAQRSTYAQALLTAVSAGAAGEPRMPLSVGVAESFHQLQRRLTIICSQMPLQAKLSRLAVVLLAALGLLSVPGIALTSRVSAADSEMASPFAQSLAATEPARNITYSGIVVDPAGVPLANVRVRLVKVSSRMALAQGTTGKDGRFTIGPVSSMNPSDRRIVSRELVFEHPDYATSCSWQVEQDTDRQDIRIRMTRPATLAGTICDPDGRPLGGALVEAWLRYWEDDTHSQLQYLSRDSGRAVVSDANGAFRFTHLPEDAKMALVVTHAQYPRYETSEDPASRPVLLAGQTDVRVSLQQGVPVALQLISQDQPLRRQGVFVVALQRRAAADLSPSGRLSLPQSPPIQEMTDSKGRASLILAPGRYTFVAIGRELSDLDLVGLPSRDVDLALDQPRNVDLNLVTGQIITGRLVDDKTGLPVAGQDVQVRPQGDGAWAYLGWQGVDRDATDARGRFRLRLPEGSHTLETQTVYAGVRRATTRSIEVRDAAPPQQIEWAIATVPRIRGHLVDAQGRGVAGTLSVHMDTIKTDDTGAFEFDDPTASGAVLLPQPAFAVDAAVTCGKAFLLQPGQAAQRLTITLEPLATVAGRLVVRKTRMLLLSEDRPVSDVIPQIEVPLGGSSTIAQPGPWQTVVAADGTLTIRLLPTGIPMKLYINQPGYEQLEVPLDGLKPGGTLHLKDVILRPNKGAGDPKGLSASVAGRVIDQTGSPVTRQEIYAYCPSIKGMEIWTDSNGRFEVKGLPARTWIWFHIRRDGYGHQSFPVLSGKKDVELKIVPPGYEWYGKSAPALMVSKWFNSQPLTLEGLRGKVVLLCLTVAIDCPGAFQDMARWQGQYGDQGLAMIAVHQRTGTFGGEIGEEQIESFLKENQVTVPAALDGPKKAAGKLVPSDRLSEWGATWSIYNARDEGPTLYLIDKKGILRCSPTRDNLDEWIRKLLVE